MGAACSPTAEEGDDSRREPLSDDDGCGVPDRRVLLEHGFDLGELDPVAAHLHHVVAPAEEVELAVGADADDIPGAIGVAGPPRLSPVAREDRGPLDHQLPFLADLRLQAVGFPGPHAVAADGAADRDARPPRVEGAGDLVGGADIRFGRTVEVPHHEARPRVAQAAQVLHRERLSREQQRSERVGLRRQQPPVLHHQRDCGGHRVPDGDPLVAHESYEVLRGVRRAFRYEADGRSGRESGVQVEHREVEMKRGVAREPIRFAGPERPTAQSTNAIAFAWEMQTPFGRPVDPDVYRM